MAGCSDSNVTFDDGEGTNLDIRSELRIVRNEGCGMDLWHG